MPASTGTHCSMCTSHRGEMAVSWGTVLVAFASWRAAASETVRFAAELGAASVMGLLRPEGERLSPRRGAPCHDETCGCTQDRHVTRLTRRAKCFALEAPLSSR